MKNILARVGLDGFILVRIREVFNLPKVNLQ